MTRGSEMIMQLCYASRSRTIDFAAINFFATAVIAAPWVRFCPLEATTTLDALPSNLYALLSMATENQLRDMMHGGLLTQSREGPTVESARCNGEMQAVKVRLPEESSSGFVDQGTYVPKGKVWTTQDFQVQLYRQ